MNDNHHSERFPTVSHADAVADQVAREKPPVIKGYQIIAFLGAGGMGTVWRARQLSTNREVALKVLRTKYFDSEMARLRFEREVELAARLRHPSIAAIYDSGLEGGEYFYAMELIEGQKLDEYVQTHKLNQQQIIALVTQIGQAVQHAHQHGVIHRDLKPSNVIVSPEGTIHVLDFGLAKSLPDEQDNHITVSVAGEMLGTLPFMSPEQAAGNSDKVDARSDIYSLGIIFYYLLTNRFPYEVDGSTYEILHNIQYNEPAPPSRLCKEISTELEAILFKALAKKPEERYQSISEMLHDIHCSLHNLPVSAAKVNTLYLLRKIILRHRYASIIIACLAIIITSSSFISIYYYVQARDALHKERASREELSSVYQEYIDYARQTALENFLSSWHKGEPARTETVAGFLAADGWLGKYAVQFLLGKGSLADRKAALQKHIFAQSPQFYYFLLGEYYFQQGAFQEASQAYNQSMQVLSGIDFRRQTNFDKWLQMKNRTRIGKPSISALVSKTKGQ